MGGGVGERGIVYKEKGEKEKKDNWDKTLSRNEMMEGVVQGE